MVKALVHAVADGAVVVEAGKHFLHACEHGVDAHGVEEGFLLASKGGVGQVFCRGRGAHGKAGLFIAFAQRGEGVANRAFERRWEGLRAHPGADFCASSSKRGHVLGVESRQARADALRQPLVLEKFAEGMRRGGKARGHAHALRQLRNHLAKAGVLAADHLDIAHAQFLERYDERVGIKEF